MITLYRRGNVFWSCRSEFGQRVRQSLNTRDREVAKALVRRMELDSLSGGRLREIRWPEFQQEFLEWIEPQVKPNTIRGYRITAKRFGKFLKSKEDRVREIGPSTITAFLEERKTDLHPSTNRHPGPGGIKFDLRCLRRIFQYAVDQGYLTANPVRQRNLNSAAGETLPFTNAELKTMLGRPELTKDLRLRAILLTFLYTGFRISDVATLSRKSVHGNFLVRQTIKRGTVVSLPILPQLREAIDALIRSQTPLQKASPYLFATSGGKPKPTRSVARDLTRFWKRCGIQGAHTHRFRDTFAVRLLEQGASLYDVAKLLGIGVQTAERHYAPWVRELQERGSRLMAMIASV
jgi:site-specific recombinase XerD